MSTTLPPAFEPWFQARCPDIPFEGAHAVLDLAARGATAPFIARYRRERTSNLDEPTVRRVLAVREQWDRLVARQAIILESIERHATLDPTLRERIRHTVDPTVLEDLYLPFRQKKKSRADAAREAGLGPLADWIWGCGHGTETPQEGQTLELWAFTFRDPEKGVPDAKTAIEGARDILVERLAENADLRAAARLAYMENGWLRATRTEKAKPHGKFEGYFEFNEKVSSLLEPASAHRYLAVRRGQAEGELLLSVSGPPGDPEFEARLVAAFEAAALTEPDSPGADVLRQAARIAFKGLVRNAMENDVLRTLKEAADVAIATFIAGDIRRMLLEAPFGPKPVLGVNPHRSGCRLAVVAGSGALVASVTSPVQTDEEKAAAAEAVVALVREHVVEAVAIAGGTSGRETELLVRRGLRAAGLAVPVVLVSDAGLGAYGTSEAARAEMPDLEAPARGAVSIARRLQDPLAELSKREPRTIGAGQYPHDVASSVLHRALGEALDGCVHEVGVSLATAPRHLLARVSGIGSALATAILDHREKAGPFRSRAQLLELPSLGPEAFELAAGFLRVPGGEHPLDDTGIHPEAYPALEACARRHGRALADLRGPGAALAGEDAELRAALGPWTFPLVLHELESAGRDPRPAFVPFAFREDVQKIDDLRPGMLCPGIVSNVTAFGAFVDVGAHHEGLVHVSQLGRRFSRDPREVIHPGERVQVRVLKVDLEKRQVSLSLKPAPPSRRSPAPRRPRRPEARGPALAGVASAPPSTGDGGERPARPQPPGPRPPGRRLAGSQPPGSSGRRPTDRPPPGRRPPAFNNPFAVLADLKGTKRKS